MSKRPLPYYPWLPTALGLIAACQFTGISPSFAISAVEDGKTKINLSGRQRMLTQRMAQAACFTHLGVDVKTHLDILHRSDSLFQQTLNGLIHGDASQGMLGEKQKNVLDSLALVSFKWTEFAQLNDDIYSKKSVSLETLNHIAEVNIPVLRLMHRTVGVIEKTYGRDGVVDPALALAINVSGRQRMLTQKAAKEFCLVQAGIDQDENRKALGLTLDLFNQSMESLIEGGGDYGLKPAPSLAIKTQLEKIYSLWKALKPIFRSASQGNLIDQSDIEKVAQDNGKILYEMNRAVFMYNNL